MKRRGTRKGIYGIRSLLFIGVLLTLCVSEGVGLQLLPFPSKGDGHSLLERFAQIGSAQHSTPIPFQEECAPRRIEVAAPKLERHLLQQHVLNLVAAAISFSNEFQDNTPQEIYPERAEPVYSLILTRQPASRAPPALA
ncbi:MAG TPA: hypothetical protein VIG62_25200 [Blastocatellia bacterium]|jgi:hypothetical protein